MTFSHWRVRAHLNALRVIKLRKFSRDILGNIYYNRAWTTACSNIKCFFEGDGDVVYIFNQEVMLHTWSSHAYHVHFLESVHANGGSRYLATNHHHRDRVHISSCNACHRICCAWPRCHKCYANLTCCA